MSEVRRWCLGVSDIVVRLQSLRGLGPSVIFVDIGIRTLACEGEVAVRKGIAWLRNLEITCRETAETADANKKNKEKHYVHGSSWGPLEGSSILKIPTKKRVGDSIPTKNV